MAVTIPRHDHIAEWNEAWQTETQKAEELEKPFEVDDMVWYNEHRLSIQDMPVIIKEARHPVYVVLFPSKDKSEVEFSKLRRRKLEYYR